MSRNKDLIAASGLAFLALILVLVTTEGNWLRLVLGLPLVLFLPGYALQAAAFPGQSPGRLERLLLSLGSSLAVATLGGLLIDWTPWGLTPGTWAGLLFAVTVTASLLAVRRRRREASYQEGWEREYAWFDVRQLALLGLAAIVVALAIWFARAPVSPEGLEGYTLLWLLPSEENGPGSVQLGVLSQEFRPTLYGLEVRSAGELLADWDEIELAPGETWNTSLDLPDTLPANAPVEAVLFLSDQPDAVYRSVKLDRTLSP